MRVVQISENPKTPQEIEDAEKLETIINENLSEVKNIFRNPNTTIEEKNEKLEELVSEQWEDS